MSRRFWRAPLGHPTALDQVFLNPFQGLTRVACTKPWLQCLTLGSRCRCQVGIVFIGPHRLRKCRLVAGVQRLHFQTVFLRIHLIKVLQHMKNRIGNVVDDVSYMLNPDIAVGRVAQHVVLADEAG